MYRPRTRGRRFERARSDARNAPYRARYARARQVRDESERARGHGSEDLGFFGEVAGDGVALATVDQLGLLLRADVLRLPAAGAEPAARRRVRRRRHVALEHDPVARPLLARVGHRHGRQQRLRVRVAARARRRRRPSPISTILPRYITATRSEMWRTTDRSCAMNTYASAEPLLQVLEQVHDPGLDRHVERRHRLVEHDHVGVERRAPGRCRCAGADRPRTRAGTG